jgi:hypothetical protein
MVEDKDGDLQKGEYIVISPNGSITRSVCPYVCADRELPEEFCKAWQSISDPSKCYLKDTRIASDAIKIQ